MAINALVERIRLEKGCRCPDIDPDGPGSAARVVMVLLTPGPADGGATMTNVLSPTKNWDQTALNLRAMMAEAGLSEDICVFWNAVPWSLDRRRDPSTAELSDGAAYLKDFLALHRGAAPRRRLRPDRAARLSDGRRRSHQRSERQPTSRR